MLVAGSETDPSLPPEDNLSPPTPAPAVDTTSPPSAPPEADPGPLSLEERVRRLEDVIASMHLAPAEWVEATQTVRPPKPAAAITATPASPAPAPPAGMEPLAPRPPIPSRTQPWLLVDIYAELRCIPRMLVDPRYRLTWHTALGAPLILAAIVLTKWFLGSIPVVGWILDLVLYPIMLYVLFKVLSREATRYRMTSPDLPLSLRL